MEQDIADLLSDAFSDTFLPSYQEEDLSFDSLKFDEGDEERKKITGNNKLSVLIEVDESEEVLSSICEGGLFPKGENWAESRISQSPGVDAKEESSDEGDSRKERDEDDVQGGTIEEVDSKEYEDTVTECRNKEDSSEDKDDVLEMQKICIEEMGSVEYRVGTVVQKDTQKKRDFRDEMVDVVGEVSSSDDLDSRELKYEGVAMDKSTEYPSEVNRQQKEYFQDREEDGGGMDHSSECSSDVIRKEKEYSQEPEENAQSGQGSYVTVEEGKNDASRRNYKELYQGLFSSQADRQEDGEKSNATEGKEEEIYEGEPETLFATDIGSIGFSKGQSPVENEDARNSLLEGLLEQQFEDDMKEFSEDDQGVIGEDYAEYPLEYFQQKVEGERTKKLEDMQIESMRMTPKHEMEGTGGEIFEWEFLDRHTKFHDECNESEETARAIPEKQSTVLKNLRDGLQNTSLEKKHTEQQDSEGDCLRKEDQGMEENRPVKDEMAEGIQEVMGRTCSFEWKKIDKRDLGDFELQKDTMVFDVISGDFLDVLDESGKVNWAEDPLITETRNSETENQDRDPKAEEISLVTESEEEKLTDVSFQYETYNVTDAQQQKFQTYNEEEERNYEQEKERTEASNQYDNDDRDCDTRQRSKDSKKRTVTFCLEPTIQRDSGSSDLEDGVSSSSDSMEDSHTSQARQFLDLEEDGDDYRRRQTCAPLQQSLAAQREQLNFNREPKIHRQNDTISRMVKSFLKICLTTVVGVLFFWWAADQLDWLGKNSVD